MKPNTSPVILREVSKGVTYLPEELPTKQLRIVAQQLLDKVNKLLDKRTSKLFRPFEQAVLDYHMEQYRATSVAQFIAADTAFRRALTDANYVIKVN